MKAFETQKAYGLLKKIDRKLKKGVVGSILLILLATIISPITQATAHAQSSPNWWMLTWPTLHSGDCEMDNARLIFYDNGYGVFYSETTTYHTRSGDVWHMRFDVKDQRNKVLFKLGTWDSPRMDEHSDDNIGSVTWVLTQAGTPPPPPSPYPAVMQGDYRFEVPFRYDPNLYYIIANSTAHYSC